MSETKEILEQLKTVRADIGKENAELGQRIDKITAEVAKTGETNAALRKELDAVKTRADEIEKSVADHRKSARLEAFRRQGIKDDGHARHVVGILIRDQFCHDVPKFADVIRRSAGELDDVKQFRATMLESGAATGSNVVPTGLLLDLVDTLEASQDIVADAEIRVNLPGNVDIPTIVSRPTFNHKRASKANALNKVAPGFGKISLRPEEGTIIFDIDNQLMAMSPMDLGTIFVRLMNEAQAGAYSYDIVKGDGTDTFNGITGFMNVTDVEDLFTLPAGKVAFQDIAYQDFWSIVAKVLARAAARGRWYMSRDILGIVAAIQTTNKQVPLLRFEGGMRSLLERPIRLGEDFPLATASAPSTPFMAFGDLSSYVVGVMGTPSISFSEHARHEYNQTQARLVSYFDIQRKHLKGMCAVKTAQQ